MASSISRLPVVLVLLAACLSHALAKDVPVNWVAGASPATVFANPGDTLVFNFKTGAASVVQVSSASCTASIIKTWGTAGPLRVPVAKAGTFFFKSGVGAQCSASKMLITATVAVPKTVTVAWTTGAPYSTINVNCGDSVVFTWGSNANHDVVTMSTKAKYDSCDFSGGLTLLAKKFGGTYTLKPTTTGVTYVGCSVGSHCKGGLQKVAVNTSC